MMTQDENWELLKRLTEDPVTARLLRRWRKSIIDLEEAERATFGDEIEKLSDVGRGKTGADR
jgi:hypothetical protein